MEFDISKEEIMFLMSGVFYCLLYENTIEILNRKTVLHLVWIRLILLLVVFYLFILFGGYGINKPFDDPVNRNIYVAGVMLALIAFIIGFLNNRRNVKLEVSLFDIILFLYAVFIYIINLLAIIYIGGNLIGVICCYLIMLTFFSTPKIVAKINEKLGLV